MRPGEEDNAAISEVSLQNYYTVIVILGTVSCRLSGLEIRNYQIHCIKSHVKLISSF